MPYRLYVRSGIIHDADKPHASAISASKCRDFKTVQEACAHTKDAGKPPKACKRCGFPKAVLEEINR